jgi:tetratricopeptide (TPR) repeat protein
MDHWNAKRVAWALQARVLLINPLLVFGMLPLILIACMVKQQIKGEYYLETHKVRTGIEFFEAELRENPKDARAHFYLGRLHLVAHQAPQGLAHLQTACALIPKSADYHFWLGVAYSQNQAPDREKESYLKALALDPDHPEALINLAHNQFEKGELEPALDSYSRGLNGKADDEQAHFNRALILKRLQRTPEAIDAWKAYLAVYPSSPMAAEAVDHLNDSGNFDFWNFRIGHKRVPCRSIGFKPFSTDLDDLSAASLKDIGKHLATEKDTLAHVIVYQKNNAALAKAKAKEIRHHLLSKSSGIDPKNLTASWFGESKSVSTGKSSHVIDYVAIIFAETKTQ